MHSVMPVPQSSGRGRRMRRWGRRSLGAHIGHLGGTCQGALARAMCPAAGGASGKMSHYPRPQSLLAAAKS